MKVYGPLFTRALLFPSSSSQRLLLFYVSFLGQTHRHYREKGTVFTGHLRLTFGLGNF